MTYSFNDTTDYSSFRFLVTGGAGFIGSHIVDYLVSRKARHIRVLDNLLTGNINNIKPYLNLSNVEFVEGDIRDLEICKKASEGVDYVTHQAALGSVPRSIKDPATTHSINSTGFLNILIAARDAKVKRFVYASSSSVYGDHPALPKKENETGNPLSPYAVSKKTNELYAKAFTSVYNMEIIGLRYFNVYGPNQSPDGPYAAVMPLFMQSVLEGKSPYIDGDGEQTRDFTFVENAVQANVRAFFTSVEGATDKVYNVAVGENITINQMYEMIAELGKTDIKAIHREARIGDIKNSLADISLARTFLKYEPNIRIEEGIRKTFDWFKQSRANQN